jgi:uncharacterized protein HemX
MDPSKVRSIAKSFDTASDVLKKVGIGLEAALVALTVTTFISLGSTAWLQKYIANIKPKVTALQKECAEMADKLRQDIKTWEKAQKAGNSI